MKYDNKQVNTQLNCYKDKFTLILLGLNEYTMYEPLCPKNSYMFQTLSWVKLAVTKLHLL